MNDYLVPYQRIRREMTVLNSRFIATLSPAFSVAEARAFIAEMRREFSTATHNVPAYIIGGGHTLTEYASDDGEPSGTAGRPALTVLRGSGLGDVALVITRYFGGTKLGTGGLVRAYTKAAQLVTASVPRARRESVQIALLECPYPLLELVRRLCRQSGVMIQDETFAADVTLRLQIPVVQLEAFEQQLANLSAGQLSLLLLEKQEALLPVE